MNRPAGLLSPTQGSLEIPTPRGVQVGAQRNVAAPWEMEPPLGIPRIAIGAGPEPPAAGVPGAVESRCIPVRPAGQAIRSAARICLILIEAGPHLIVAVF